MIYKDKCLELGLPESQSYHNQANYVKYLLLQSLTFNTRKARFVGIHNLHTLISKLKRKGLPIETRHRAVWCPFTNTVPPQAVDVIAITPENLAEYQSKKSREEN